MYVAYPLKFSVPEVVQATWEKIGIFQSHTLLAAHLGTVHISTGAHLYIRNRYPFPLVRYITRTIGVQGRTAVLEYGY